MLLSNLSTKVAVSVYDQPNKRQPKGFSNACQNFNSACNFEAIASALRTICTFLTDYQTATTATGTAICVFTKTRAVAVAPIALYSIGRWIKYIDHARSISV